MKSTPEQIRARFDADVERFSNLETGQSATMDAALCMDLVTSAAAAVTPHAYDLLDIGCGAGNYTLKMLQQIPNLNCTLIDLSEPMLTRARERVTAATRGQVTTLQGDMRNINFGENAFDIALAAATLHHLRTDDQWHTLFTRVFQALRPDGTFWIFDLIAQTSHPLEQLMQRRYSDYLIALKGGGREGEAYRDKVFAYIDEEDSQRPLPFQLSLLANVGFTDIDILHKNGPFAAFGGRKA